MNDAELKAWISTHKPQTAATALVVVAGGYTYLKRRKAAQVSAAGAAPTPASVYQSSGALGGTTGTAYDSSANDVYNSVQGVLEQLQATAAQMSTTPAVATLPPVTLPMLPGGGVPRHTFGPDVPADPTWQLGVATAVDEQGALAAGIPKSWLFRTTNPNEGQANYADPTDLPMLGTPTANTIYVGLANKVAPPGSTTLFGADRNATAAAEQAWAAQHVKAGAK